MNRNEQEYYANIAKIAKSLERIDPNTEKIVRNTFKGIGSGGPVMVKGANKVKYI